MVSSAAPTVEAYLAELPPERRAVIASVRDLVNRHLPPGYVEAMAWGMIGWGIPLARYPDTYNKQPLCYVGLAAQKNNYALYLMGVYAESTEEDGLRAAYARAGKKLDMGKCCLRFKSLEGLLLEEVAKVVAGTTVDEYIARYEASRAPSANKASAKIPAKKASSGKAKSAVVAATKAASTKATNRAAGAAKPKVAKPAAKVAKKVADKKASARKVAGKTVKAAVKTVARKK
jgi:hypothetical protein